MNSIQDCCTFFSDFLHFFVHRWALGMVFLAPSMGRCCNLSFTSPVQFVLALRMPYRRRAWSCRSYRGPGLRGNVMKRPQICDVSQLQCVLYIFARWTPGAVLYRSVSFCPFRLWMQVLSMMFWAVTRVGLVFILGICVLIDAKRSLASTTRMDANAKVCRHCANSVIEFQSRLKS